MDSKQKMFFGVHIDYWDVGKCVISKFFWGVPNANFGMELSHNIIKKRGRAIPRVANQSLGSG